MKLIKNSQIIKTIYIEGNKIKKIFKNGIKVYDAEPVAFMPKTDTYDSTVAGSSISIGFSAYADYNQGAYASIAMYYNGEKIYSSVYDMESGSYITFSGYNKGGDMYSYDGIYWNGEYIYDTVTFNRSGTYKFVGEYIYNGLNYQTGALTITVS